MKRQLNNDIKLRTWVEHPKGFQTLAVMRG